LQCSSIEYPQADRSAFIPNLSIIDVLMFNDREQISKMLRQFDLMDPEEQSGRTIA
jgi:hypothetical protein